MEKPIRNHLMDHQKGIPTLAVLLFVLSAIIRPGCSEAEGNEGLTIGVVNVDRVMSQSHQWQDFQHEHLKLQDKARKVMEKHQQQIRVLRNKLENLPEGTEMYDNKREDLRLAMLEYQQIRQKYNEKLKDHRFKNLSTIFTKIQGIIEDYASDKGISLVLKKQKAGISSMAPEEIGIVVATGDVLYADNSLEITDPIIKRLNVDYSEAILEK